MPYICARLAKDNNKSGKVLNVKYNCLKYSARGQGEPEALDGSDEPRRVYAF